MDLKKIILRKLYRRKVIGGKHTAIEYIIKGIPKHYIGDSKIIIKDLIQENLILTKPTSYGL